MRFLPPVKTPAGEVRLPIAEKTAFHLILCLCRTKPGISLENDLCLPFWGDPFFACWVVNNYWTEKGLLPPNAQELLCWLSDRLYTILQWSEDNGFNPTSELKQFERKLAEQVARWFLRVFGQRVPVSQPQETRPAPQLPQRITAPDSAGLSPETPEVWTRTSPEIGRQWGDEPPSIPWPAFLAEVLALGPDWITLLGEETRPLLGNFQPVGELCSYPLTGSFREESKTLSQSHGPAAWPRNTSAATVHPAGFGNNEDSPVLAAILSEFEAEGKALFLWDVELGVCPGEQLIRQIVDVLPDLVGKLREHSELEARFTEKLERAALDALAEFSAGAAHELNNPLAIISGRAQLLLRSETSPDRRMALATIIAQARRAHEMLADLRLFARPPCPELRTVDLAELVKNIGDEFRKETEATGISLQSKVPEAPVFCEVDPVQIRVALEAICRNAVEALGESGQIHIDLACEENEVVIRVQDNGPGISPEYQPLVFHPFFSGRSAGRGLGFGLSKAWRIVQIHGGRLDLHSIPGSGTLVVVRLPRSGISRATQKTSPLQ